MKRFSGYYAALLTPFSKDDSIAEDALGRLVRRNLECGLTGLYVGGSTGESFLQSPEERARVLAVVAEAGGGDGTLVAHVGDTNPAVSFRLAREAERLGYDAVSAVPPFYYGYSGQELREHYRRLAGATELPFLIYNFPALSGVRFSADELADILELPNVVGVKNTCADFHGFERLRRRCPDKTLLHGFDETLLAGLALGADGAIGSTYNVQGKTALALGAAASAGETGRAQTLQYEMNALIDVLLAHGVLRSLKYMLTALDLPMGDCRPPFSPLDAAARASLDRAVDTYLRGSDKPAGGVATAGE